MWKLEVSETNVAIALATSQCGEDTGEVSPPVGVRGKLHILGAKWHILRPFSGGAFFAYLSLLKVLRSWVNRFWKNLSGALSDDSVALWTAALWERKAER